MNVPHNERSPGEDVMGQKGQREKLPESVIETIYREITVQQQVVLKETRPSIIYQQSFCQLSTLLTHYLYQ